VLFARLGHRSDDGIGRVHHGLHRDDVMNADNRSAIQNGCRDSSGSSVF
jgi:hypothetical protein